MSSIVLSAAVRQNLLSLQDTAQMLSQTQNILSTGNKVNSALDNPTSFFAAQGLNNRATDLSNLLDGVSNGISTLQTANSGITSIQSYIQQAKSIAQQAQQAPSAYSQKSTITSGAILNNGTAITANNLLGTGTLVNQTITGNLMTAGTPTTVSETSTALDLATATATSSTVLQALPATAGGSLTGATSIVQTTPSSVVPAVALTSSSAPTGTSLGSGGAAPAATTFQGQSLMQSAAVATTNTLLSSLGIGTSGTITVAGVAVTFTSGSTATPSAPANTLTIGNGATLTSFLTALKTAAGSHAVIAPASAFAGGQFTPFTTTSAAAYTDDTNGDLAKLGFTTTASTKAPTTSVIYDVSNPIAATGATYISTQPANAPDQAVPSIANPLTASDTLVVNGKTLTFGASSPTDPAGAYSPNGGSLAVGTTLTQLANAINAITGATTATVVGGSLTIASSAAADVSLQGSALAKLGLSQNAAPTAQLVVSPTFGTATAAIGSGTALSAVALNTVGLTALAGPPAVAGSAVTSNDTLTVNGNSINFNAANAGANNPTGNPPTLYVGAGGATLNDLLTAINQVVDPQNVGNPTNWAVQGAFNAAGVLTLTSTAPVSMSGSILPKLGLAPSLVATPAPTYVPGANPGGSLTLTPTNINAATSAITSSSQLANLNNPITGQSATSSVPSSDNLVVNVNGTASTISFLAGTGTNTSTATGATIYVGNTSSTISTILSSINQITGGTAAVNANGTVNLTSAAGTTLTISGGALNKLGLTSQTGSTASIVIAPSAATETSPGFVNGTSQIVTNGLSYSPGQVTASIAVPGGTNSATPLSSITGFTAIANGTSLQVNVGGVATTINFTTTGNLTNISPNGSTLSVAAAGGATVGDLLNAIAAQTGGTATLSTGPTADIITLTSNPTQLTTISGTDLTSFGFSTSTPSFGQTQVAAGSAVTNATSLSLISGLSGNGLTLTDVNGATRTISFSAVTGGTSVSASGGTLNVNTASVGNLLTAINTVTGGVATLNNGILTINSNPNAATVSTGIGMTYGGAAATALGLPLGAGGKGTISVIQPNASGVMSTSMLSELAVNGSGTSTLETGLIPGSTLVVNNTTITFGQQQATTLVSNSSTGIPTSISLSGAATMQDLYNAIGQALGGNTSSVTTTANGITLANGASVGINANGNLQISAGGGGQLQIGGTASGTLGLTASTYTPGPTANLASATTPLSALGTVGTSGNLIVDGTTITFGTANQASTMVQSSSGISLSTTATVQDLINAVSAATGGPVSLNSNGQLSITSQNGGAIVIGGSNAAALGLTSVAAGASTVNSTTAVNQNTILEDLYPPVSAGSTLVVTDQSGKAHSFSFGGAASLNSNGTGYTANGNNYQFAEGATVGQLLSAIQAAGGPGTSASLNAAGKIVISTTNTTASSPVTLTGTATYALGISTDQTGATAVTAGPTGGTLSFGAIGNGQAVTVTFGSNSTAGQVSTLDELNSALAVDNLQATLDAAGHLSISTTDNYASYSIGTVGGSAASLVDGGFTGKSASGPVVDVNAIATRANLVNEYNAVLTQIDSTAADASYQGINLLTGDTLTMTFDETGKSQIKIQGYQTTSLGLGLDPLNSSSTGMNDFSDNSKLNAILANLNNVNTTLTNQASALSSNLTVIQSHQDFDKALITTLQTGAANLTQADINTEVANTQALQTRQSLAVSALQIANQSQNAVIQLLR